MPENDTNEAAAAEAPTDVDTIKGDVQEQWDKVQEQGFRGVKVDPRDNSEYSLESGPDAPRAFTDTTTRAAQLAAPTGAEDEG